MNKDRSLTLEVSTDQAAHFTEIADHSSKTREEMQASFRELLSEAAKAPVSATAHAATRGVSPVAITERGERRLPHRSQAMKEAGTEAKRLERTLYGPSGADKTDEIRCYIERCCS